MKLTSARFSICWKVTLGCVLAAALATASVPIANAVAHPEGAQAEPGGTVAIPSSVSANADFTKSEVVYAQLSASGAPENAYIVNRFDVATGGNVEDFGDYSSVRNLTNTAQLQRTDDKVEFSAAAGAFYYQGNLAQFQLPWLVKLSYKLNGVETDASALAGKTGALQINISTEKNPAANAAFYDSFMQQITFTFDGHRAKNITAKNATLAAAGANTTATFTVLPGKSGNFTVNADVVDFIMDGVQIAALPYESTFDMPDTSSLVNGMQELADGVNTLASGSTTLAEGAESLGSGVAELNSGAEKFGDGLGKVAGSSGALVSGSAKIEDGLDAISSALAEVDFSSLEQLAALPDQLEAISETLVDEQVQQKMMLAGIAKALRASLAESDFSQFDQLVQGVKALAVQYSTFHSGLQQYTDGVDQLSGNYSSLESGIGKLADGANDLASGANRFSNGVWELDANTSTLPGTVKSEVDKMMAEFEFPKFEPVSFASSKNKNITTVQFVITTAAIELPKVEAEPEAPAKEQTPFDRLLALFR